MSGDQVELFTGVQLRDVGVAHLAEVDGEWEAAANHTLRTLILTGAPFTAADLVDAIGMPSRPNKVGAFFISAAKAGAIRPTGGYARARRAVSHARVMREWVGA